MGTLLRNYVGGEWIETGRTFANLNPVNGSRVCDVVEADQATVARAVTAARRAVDGDDHCPAPLTSSEATFG